MTGTDQFQTAFGFSSLLICLTSLLFTAIQQRTDKEHNQIYIALIYTVFFNTLCSLGALFIEPMLDEAIEAVVTYQILHFLYFTLHNTLAPLFYIYVTSVCGAAFQKNKKRNILYISVFAVTELLLITNPVTKFVYYCDREHHFQRNFGEIFIYGSAVFFFILAFRRLLSSWNALTRKRRTALIYFFVLVVICIITQLLFPKITVELFGESLGLMGIMLSVETEDDKIDIDTGFYNRKALKLDLEGFLINKRPVSVLVLKITNADIIIRTTGSENSDILSYLLSDYLRSVVPRFHIYNASPGTFVLTMPDKGHDEVRKLAEQISNRFESTWRLQDMDIPLTAVILAAKLPGEHINNTSQAFYMIDSPVPDNDKKVLMDSDLNYLIRRAAVENAISKGIEKNSFQVFYQPTYCMSDRRLHGAEALLRMHDDELGDISPDEFIPIAEQMGMIDELDDFVLREVCRMIKTGIPAANGLRSININLSVLDCIKPGFAEHIERLVEEIGVDKHFINFEITESVAADDYMLLSRVVSALKGEGFMFSMDDYGTGYSNLNAILSLNFDIIKIDKSLLRGAEKTELGRIMLENTVKMFKQMNREVLVEGVETAEQAALLANLDVDYLQGYFFSRPIPEDEFIRFISR